MKLNEISDNPGATKARMRVGRGIGSGKGKTGGRGVKGQKARTGVAIKGFEGGQMPLHRRLPKRGFNNPGARDLNEINLGRLQAAVEAGRLDTGVTITVATLVAAGLLSKRRDGVKLLGDGEFSTKLTFEVTGASRSAVKAIEQAGGSVKFLEREEPKVGVPESRPLQPAYRLAVATRPPKIEIPPVGNQVSGGRLADDPRSGMLGGATDRAQELLASMRSTSPTESTRRERVVREVSQLLAAQEIAKPDEVDHRRRELIPLARELVKTAFGDEAGPARQAAYALVANAPAHRGSLDPAAEVGRLSPEDLGRFRSGLSALIAELDIPCLSKVKAYRSEETRRGHPIVMVSIRLTTALPFDIAGRPFTLKPPPFPPRQDVELTVGCPVAEEHLSTSSVHPADVEDIIVETISRFVVPTAELGRGRIPVSFVTPWSVENRSVSVERAV